MSNSSLVSYTKLSPNHSGARTASIDRITPHCVVGQLSAETICDCFTSPSVKASCNYGIGTDGRISLVVEEKNRSWCSSSNSNDQRAVTIECASGKVEPYEMNDKVYASLIKLCVDICKRNGKTKLLWFGDKTKSLNYSPKSNEMVLTVHRWFANKSCPGNWLYARMGDLASKVTSQLGGSSSSNTTGSTSGYTKVAGSSKATSKQMISYIKSVNPKIAQSVIDMIPYYLSEGFVEGIRGDVAFAQSCLETGNFTFSGSAVTLDQNNFCGMGVTANGMKGNSFKTPQLGIRAQIQHLKAYANKESLKQECVDPRFSYVDRGCAKYVEYLGIQENPQHKGWAAGSNYGSKILKILKAILAEDAGSTTTDSKPTAETKTMYRVRKSWANKESQVGAFESLANAKKCADENPGYSVFDENGKSLYTSAMKEFKVKVTTPNLRIRTGAGTNYTYTGSTTGDGIFTIVDTAPGTGSTKGWGKLKSGAGWISLDYTEEV